MGVTPGVLKLARAVALAGAGAGSSHNFKVASVVFKGPRIYSAKPNIRFHPLGDVVIRHGKVLKHGLHAEKNAIVSLGEDNCYGLDMLVVRILRSGALTMARPCPSCMQYIQGCGIRRVYYSDWEGNISVFSP